MPTQRKRNQAYVAGLPGPREYSPESRRITTLYPDLHVRVWCNALGINVLAYIDSSRPDGSLRRVEVAKTTFRGTPPKEGDVVLWAARALTSWLESHIMALGELELTGLL